MYEYKFIEIKLKNGFLTRSPETDYHEVIKKHAKEGWRLVQIFAPSIAGSGAPMYYELIFEKLK